MECHLKLRPQSLYQSAVFQANGNGVKEEETKEKPVVPEVKKAAAPEKGVKRKFGETGLSPEELKPWNIR